MCINSIVHMVSRTAFHQALTQRLSAAAWAWYRHHREPSSAGPAEEASGAAGLLQGESAFRFDFLRRKEIGTRREFQFR